MAKRFTARVAYGHRPDMVHQFELSFGQAVRKDVRERLQAECGGEWSESGSVLRKVSEDQQERAEAIVREAYPHASVFVTDARPERHRPDCRLVWSKPESDWYAPRVGWLGDVVVFKSSQTTNRDDPNKYKIYTFLPGFGGERTVVAVGTTQVEAEINAEEVLSRVIRWMGLTFQD